MSHRLWQVRIEFLFFSFLINVRWEERNTLQLARLYVSGTLLNVTGPIGQLATAGWDVTNLKYSCSLSLAQTVHAAVTPFVICGDLDHILD